VFICIGVCPDAALLTTETILKRAGGKARRQAYREAVQGRLTAGEEGDLPERLRNGVAFGTAVFAEGVRKRLRDGGREIAGSREARGRVDWTTCRCAWRFVDNPTLSVNNPLRCKMLRGYKPFFRCLAAIF